MYLPSSNCTWKSDRFCHRWITLGVSVTNQVDSTIFSTIIWPFNQHLQKEFCDFTETDVLASKVCRHMVKPLMPQWVEFILEVAFSLWNTQKSVWRICQRFSYLLDEGIPKIWKKLNSLDGFMSYLQNSTVNSAHLAARAPFCTALVCPKKATVRIQFLSYFWNPLIK